MAKLTWLIVIVATSLVLIVGINKPMYGHHDWNGVYYGNIARNYLKLGLAKTKLGQATSTGFYPSQLNFYTHYPPLLPWSLAVSYKLFNISNIATRLVPVFFSFASILLLFSLSRLLKFSLLASLASCLVIFTPMFRYFSHMPDQELLIVFFTLLSLWFYLQGQKTGFFLSAIFNALTAWAGYFLYPLLAIHSYFFNRRWFKTCLQALVILIIIFCLHLTHTYILTGSLFGGSLIEALLLRLNISHLQGKIDPSLRQFTLSGYLVQQARWITVYYTYSLLLAAAAFIILTARRIIKKLPLEPAQLIITLLLLWALCYPIIFSNVVFIHEYFNFFFLPFFGLSLAWMINQLQAKTRILALTVFIITGLAIYFERLPFFQALANTQAHQSGYQLGQLINQTLEPNQSALVFASSGYLSNHEVFIKFYADRAVNFTVYDYFDWYQVQPQLTDYSYIFTVTQDQPELFIDQALATSSAVIQSTKEFNFYQL